MKRLLKLTTFLHLILAAGLLAGGTGCGVKDRKPSKLFSLDSAWPFEGDEEELKEGIPIRMVGTWTDTVRTQAGQPAQRGFGGRLMFYGEKDEKAILVDGQLVVYAFDETGRDPTDNKPTRRYVFPAAQMPSHMSKNEMGATYSFWLPWDEASGPKTEVSLICRFEPVGGAIITGEQTRHLLPGTSPLPGATVSAHPPKLPEGVPSRPATPTLESIRARQQATSGAQLASYELPAGAAGAPAVMNAAGTVPVANGESPRQMSVTSIALPANYQIPVGPGYSPPAAGPRVVAPQPTSVMQPAPAVQYQQVAPAAQPVYQSARPGLTTGASVSQPAQQSSIAQAAAVQQPTVAGYIAQPMRQPIATSPIAAAGIATAPQATMPITTPQFAPQQPIASQGMQPMIAPNGVPVAPRTPRGSLSQPQILAPQLVQQASYQQSPTAQGVRTALNYSQAPNQSR